MTHALSHQPTGYDPFDGLLMGDPYDVYSWLRANAPIYHSERHAFWALSRHDDVIAAARDWETFSTAAGVDIDGTGDAYGSGDFLEEDPPRHDVLRAVVRAHFIPKRLRMELTEPVRAEVKRLFGEMRERRSVDLARDLAWPLPVAVGTALLGIPPSDREQLLGLQRRLAERTPGVREMPSDARAAGTALQEYFRALIASRRAEPGGDLVSTIAKAEVDGQPIGDDAVGLLFLLFVASMETTASSIGNALALLDSHPDQRRWLAHHPESVDRAVEEVLRYDAPVQVTKRVTKSRCEINGATIPPGADVFLLLASANRDERRYEHADAFDIRRDQRRHLAFGDGIHHCLGAPLARLELSIVLEEMLTTGITVELDEPARRLSSHFIRGFAELPGWVT